MRRILLAIRALWAVLRSRELAQRIHELLTKKSLETPPPPTEPAEKPSAEKAPPPREAPPGRSEALTLLAALQREARFVDFIMEPLNQYSDAQIGAAVRDIHRDCARVIERIFGLRPIVSEPEGTPMELSPGYDAARFRVVGHTGQSGVVRARVVHRGWEATRCELPVWSGSAAASLVIAPAELEVEGGAIPRWKEGIALPPENLA